MAEEKRSLLQPAPEPGPRPEPELSGQTSICIPQPDGSVLFVTPPPPGGPPVMDGARGGGGTSGFGPAPNGAEQPDDEQPQPKPPLPPSQGYDPAPGYTDWGAVDRGHGGYLAPLPDHMSYPQQEKPTAGPAPGVLGGEGAGYRPPHSQAMLYDQGAGIPPKPPQAEPNRAPDRVQQPYPPNPPQQFFHHQAYRPYQPPPNHPSFQLQPYQPPFPQHPYQPYQQVPGQFPAVRYQHPPQARAVAQYPPLPTKCVKTSRKFDTKTVGDNQYYLSICLFILVCICCNPFPLFCAIPGFLAAKTAAIANEGDDVQKAQQYHKRAQSFNIGSAATFILSGTLFVPIVFVVVAVVSANIHN